jgi:hypothetical protein
MNSNLFIEASNEWKRIFGEDAIERFDTIEDFENSLNENQRKQLYQFFSKDEHETDYMEELMGMWRDAYCWYAEREAESNNT